MERLSAVHAWTTSQPAKLEGVARLLWLGQKRARQGEQFSCPGPYGDAAVSLARLPFRYELASLAEGERTVAGRLLSGLTPNDLVLMDQGFWSYGLFWQIQNQQAFFAVRLFPGVKFRTIEKVGCQDRLVEWTPCDHQWRRAELPTSIRLRVINYQIKGFRPSALVTNVLSPRRVSRGVGFIWRRRTRKVVCTDSRDSTIVAGKSKPPSKS